MRSFLIGVSTVIVCLVALFACDDLNGPPRPLALQVLVESDPGISLAGVPVRLNGKHLGTSNSEGRLTTSARAWVGRTLRISPECPEGYTAYGGERQLKVRRYGRGPNQQSLRVRLSCKPTVRIAAFVVRAEGGAGALVRVDGVDVATINGEGLAHFTRSAVPGTDVLVELDARQRSRLRPSLISRSVVIPDFHELFVIDAVFAVNPRGPKSRRERTRIIKIE